MATVLALLVGGNPLPNLVTALALRQRLAPQPVSAFLFYTPPHPPSGARGQQVAQRTAALLRQRGFVPEEVGLHPLSGADIAGDAPAVRDQIAAALAHHPRLHLDYTGGTKAMARGAWLAAEQLARAGAEVTVSYLDYRPRQSPARPGHSLRFCTLGPDGAPRRDADGRERWQESGDLRTVVRLEVEELARLHGFELAWEEGALTGEAERYRLTLLAAFQQAVEHLGSQVTFVSPRVARLVPPGRSNGFTIDLVALAGYQLWAGAVPSDPSRPEAVRHAAFQTLMRATLVGGEEARACVASALLASDVQAIERTFWLYEGSGALLDRVTIFDRDTMARPELLRQRLQGILR